MRVGLSPNSTSRKKAEGAGLKVETVADASKWADVIMILTPDTSQAEIYKTSIEPFLTAGKALMFAHGFNIRFGTVKPPANVDVSMIAPKSPGHRVRELYVEEREPLQRCSRSIRTRPARPSRTRSLTAKLSA